MLASSRSLALLLSVSVLDGLRGWPALQAA